MKQTAKKRKKLKLLNFTILFFVFSLSVFSLTRVVLGKVNDNLSEDLERLNAQLIINERETEETVETVNMLKEEADPSLVMMIESDTH